MEFKSINSLVGKTFTSVVRTSTGDEYNGGDSITFNGNETYKFFHEQDCCEDVVIEDICGDLSDLENTPIIVAEVTKNIAEDTENCDERTWTFYKFSTVKGFVTVRWFGQSNGYYSTDVNFVKVLGNGEYKGIEI